MKSHNRKQLLALFSENKHYVAKAMNSLKTLTTVTTNNIENTKCFSLQTNTGCKVQTEFIKN